MTSLENPCAARMTLSWLRIAMLPLRAEVDGPVEALDEIWVDREQDHAGRTVVGIAKPAQHLQR